MVGLIAGCCPAYDPSICLMIVAWKIELLTELEWEEGTGNGCDSSTFMIVCCQSGYMQLDFRIERGEQAIVNKF